MDFNEKVLYHQIHPAKLAADVSGSLLSSYLMWRGGSPGPCSLRSCPLS